MKTVKQYQSLSHELIPDAISNDVSKRIEAIYQKALKRLKSDSNKDIRYVGPWDSGCRLGAHAYMVGHLQGLLTIAIWDLKEAKGEIGALKQAVIRM